MIPLTKKQARIILLVVGTVVLNLLLVGFILYTNHKNYQKVTPEMQADLTEATNLNWAVRQMVKNDKPFYLAAERAAKLAVDTIEPGVDFKIYVTYYVEGEEPLDGFVYGGSVPKIRNNAVKETTELKIENSIMASTIVTTLRKTKEDKIQIKKILFVYEDESGKHELVDADMDGKWDN